MFRRKGPLPVTRDEVTDIIRMIMRIDWKLDLILEELEIDDGEEEETD